jgi:hypothetical protein
MICLSQRDDADGMGRGFSERYKGNALSNHTNANPSFLAIVLARVGTNKKKATEHFFHFDEVEAWVSACWRGSWLRPVQKSL